MNRYLWAARAMIVVIGSVLITRGTLPPELLYGPHGPEQSSTDLLHDKQSPFQQLQEIPGHAEEVKESAPSTRALVVRTFEHSVRKGATFASLWREIGGRARDVDAALEVLKGAGVSLKSLKQGELVAVTHHDGEVFEVRKRLSSDATAVLVRNEQGAYAARVERIKSTLRERRVTGAIFSSLVDSASELSLPYALVDDFVDLFSNRVEFRKDLQPGDSFTVVFEERVAEDGERLELGSIKAASLQLSGNLLAVVRDTAKDGTVRYFDEKGEMPTKAFLRYPLKYTRISSMFTHARFHPVLKISRPHNGVDFAAPTGTPVRSVGDGTVVYAGYSSSTGNMIRVAHDSRYTTEYMHLNSIAKGAHRGARISRGDVIGAVGKTGLASGPHLHFGLFDKGRYVDPMRAKVTHAPASIKPPAAVLAMIEDLKKAHRSIAVAARGSSKKKA